MTPRLVLPVVALARRDWLPGPMYLLSAFRWKQVGLFTLTDVHY